MLDPVAARADLDGFEAGSPAPTYAHAAEHARLLNTLFVALAACAPLDPSKPDVARRGFEVLRPWLDGERAKEARPDAITFLRYAFEGAFQRGDTAWGVEALEQALTLARAQAADGDDGPLARLLVFSASWLVGAGDARRARGWLEEGLAIAEAQHLAGDALAQHAAAFARMKLAEVLGMLGETEAATTEEDRHLEVLRGAATDPDGRGTLSSELYRLGRAALGRDDQDRARALLAERVEVAQALVAENPDAAALYDLTEALEEQAMLLLRCGETRPGLETLLAAIDNGTRLVAVAPTSLHLGIVVTCQREAAALVSDELPRASLLLSALDTCEQWLPVAALPYEAAEHLADIGTELGRLALEIDDIDVARRAWTGAITGHSALDGNGAGSRALLLAVDWYHYGLVAEDAEAAFRTALDHVAMARAAGTEHEALTQVEVAARERLRGEA